MEAGGFYRFAYLIGSAILSTLYTLAVLVWPIEVLRVALGAFVLFFAPGYALGSLIFGKCSGLPWVADLALAVGLSALYLVLVGFVLLAFGIGLSANLLGPASLAIGVVSILVFDMREGGGVHSPIFAVAKRELSLPGFSPAQRTAAYGLVLAIGLVLSGVTYLTFVMPTDSPDVVLGIYGPNGTTDTLPSSGQVNTTMTVIVHVRNGGAGPPLSLRVRATLNTSSWANYTVVPWALPLSFHDGVESSTPLNLSSGQTATIPVTFEITFPGTYIVSFALLAGSASPVRSAVLGLTISG